MTPPPASEWIDAGQFWSLYYSGCISRMQRRAGDSVAGIYDHYEKDMILPEERQFACQHQTLVGYDYSDWKFAAPVSASVSTSLITVLESPGMAEESAVHWQQLQFAAQVSATARFWRNQDYKLWRNFLVDYLRRTEVSMQEVESEFQRWTPSQVTADLYDRFLDARYLGLGRQLALKAFGFLTTQDKAFTKISDVVVNTSEDLDTHRIALWALGRHNHKNAIALLLNRLSSPMAGNLSVPIERSLQYLCSGDELLPMQYENETAYWNAVALRLPATPAEWLELDAASVFWEKRLRAAMDPALSPVTRRVLQSDEVPAVRQAAL